VGDIEFAKENRIAIFRINRPDNMGILTVKAMRALTDAFLEFRDDDELWVGILTGTGEKVFSAGVDVKEFLDLIRTTPDHKWRRPTAIMRGLQVHKPIIAACNGLTIGGGLEMALACDIMIAAENASFGLTEAKVGMCPGGGGAVRLPRTIPRRLAAEMLFTGKTIDAREAYRIGLVNKVVPLNQLMGEAKKMAQTICDAAPLAVRYIKEIMTRSADLPLEEALRLEDDFETMIMRTRDFEEGMNAFKEKRKPRWEGK
jgi:enoyl-CoA hydratase/carnithine racemase